MINRLKIQSVLLIWGCSVVCFGADEKSDSCGQRLMEHIKNYRYSLNAKMATAGFFNVELLESQLKDGGIPAKEAGQRVSDYILRLDEIQRKLVKLKSYNAMCKEAVSKLLIVSEGINNEEYLFLYTFVDAKFTNISQERKAYYMDRIFVPIAF